MELLVAATGSTLQVIRQALAGTPHRLLEVGSSAELLRACLRGQATLALVDLELGPLPGVELIGLLREMDRDLLLVPIAGPSDPGQEFAVRTAGVFYYMIKPMDTAELLAVLESAARICAESGEARQLQRDSA
jgi:DNA-binding response OmpR family regulator